MYTPFKRLKGTLSRLKTQQLTRSPNAQAEICRIWRGCRSRRCAVGYPPMDGGNPQFLRCVIFYSQD